MVVSLKKQTHVFTTATSSRYDQHGCTAHVQSRGYRKEGTNDKKVLHKTGSDSPVIYERLHHKREYKRTATTTSGIRRMRKLNEV
jgi:hypothetical protein